MCGNWKLDSLFLKAEVRSQEDKWGGDAKPEEEQHQQCSKGYSTRGVLAPQEEVQEKEDAEHDGREPHRSHHSIHFPVHPLAHFVAAGTEVPSKNAHENEE